MYTEGARQSIEGVSSCIVPAHRLAKSGDAGRFQESCQTPPNSTVWLHPGQLLRRLRAPALRMPSRVPHAACSVAQCDAVALTHSHSSIVHLLLTRPEGPLGRHSRAPLLRSAMGGACSLGAWRQSAPTPVAFLWRARRLQRRDVLQGVVLHVGVLM